jgi:hypothetical protein
MIREHEPINKNALAPFTDLEKNEEKIKFTVNELSLITTDAFPFSKKESENGISVTLDSPSHKIWTLISQRDDKLQHPFFQNLESVEALGYQYAVECENEIYLNSIWCGIYDRISYIDKRAKYGIVVEELDREQLKQQCTSIYKDWCVAVRRINLIDDVLKEYCNDRVKRINNALHEYKKAIDDNLFIPGDWKPSDHFVKALISHAFKLTIKFPMTNQYTIQNCISEITRRPLFVGSEYSRLGYLSTTSDKYNTSIANSPPQERFSVYSALLKAST